ncbi:MAG: type IV pilus twitching motility protein PilT [Proteobacteria bacterium]|nr:type IV pilus twitching motility protein PilT [Pseudomonadota bacterium]
MSTSQLQIDDLLRTAVERDASDIHIKAESPPLLRIYGELIPTDLPALSPDEAKRLSYSVLTPQERESFEQDWELDLGYDIEGLARFRVNLMVQRGLVGAVFRIIPLHVQTIEELALPEVCRYFAERPRGLVLVTGPAGCGKSTTQAAMIDHINKDYPVHIVTVEDPIEFVHEPKVALINQRELGRDTRSFSNALKYVLRQDPDTILVGEMRDLETVQLAIRASETGHLVLGTLHTTDAVQTVDRVIDIFPTHQQQQIRMQLSVNLLGVVSQILVRRADGRGRVAAFETLVAIPSVRNSIRERKTHQIGSVIQTGAQHGMMTLDQSLSNLARSGVIAVEEGEAKAKNRQEYRQLLESGEAVSIEA